eukprot:TRINITY_DN1533_c0_g1_i1.p1 TRINITY_DN1533_c0_g1~~TRINITY_DN1533_c0_g1_i1.p1  ORF type:complete len:231 (-),score=64.55 TRINITY_DN1533_c0_g1_i1:68-727(-)
MIIWLVVVLSWILLFCFITICIACGLYYLAELVEEYPTFTRKILRCAILVVLGLHILLLILEEFPKSLLGLGIIAHIIYYKLLNQFPILQITSPLFLSACVCAVANHFFWLKYFTGIYAPFTEIVALFLVCVWLIPFGYFISLASYEGSLPYSNTNFSNNSINITNTNNNRDIFNNDTSEITTKKHKRLNRLISWFNFLKQKRNEILPEVINSDSVKLS